MIAELRVDPGDHALLAKRDPGSRLGMKDKVEGAVRLETLVAELADLHNRLWAEQTRSVLLVLQGLDASGKDGTIRRILTGVNPQGCRIVAFKEPSETELAHDYLWRVHANCPARGELGIFNRSHYEDLVAVRVRKLARKEVWSRRPQHVREFERLLVEEGTRVIKVFLHVSKDEQRRRLQARRDDPTKRWKFRLGDLDDRKLWDEYTTAYEETITETSTDWAPWHVVPADHNWVRNVAVATLLVETLREMDPRYPEPPEDLTKVTIQ